MNSYISEGHYKYKNLNNENSYFPPCLWNMKISNWNCHRSRIHRLWRSHVLKTEVCYPVSTARSPSPQLQRWKSLITLFDSVQRPKLSSHITIQLHFSTYNRWYCSLFSKPNIQQRYHCSTDTSHTYNNNWMHHHSYSPMLTAVVDFTVQLNSQTLYSNLINN